FWKESMSLVTIPSVLLCLAPVGSRIEPARRPDCRPRRLRRMRRGGEVDGVRLLLTADDQPDLRSAKQRDRPRDGHTAQDGVSVMAAPHRADAALREKALGCAGFPRNQKLSLQAKTTSGSGSGLQKLLLQHRTPIYDDLICEETVVSLGTLSA